MLRKQVHGPSRRIHRCIARSTSWTTWATWTTLPKPCAVSCCIVTPHLLTVERLWNYRCCRRSSFSFEALNDRCELDHGSRRYVDIGDAIKLSPPREFVTDIIGIAD